MPNEGRASGAKPEPAARPLAATLRPGENAERRQLHVFVGHGPAHPGVGQHGQLHGSLVDVAPAGGGQAAAPTPGCRRRSAAAPGSCRSMEIKLSTVALRKKPSMNKSGADTPAARSASPWRRTAAGVMWRTSRAAKSGWRSPKRTMVRSAASFVLLSKRIAPISDAG